MKRSRPKRNLHAGLACSPALQHRNATQPPFQVAAIDHKPEHSNLRSLSFSSTFIDLQCLFLPLLLSLAPFKFFFFFFPLDKQISLFRLYPS